MMVKKFIRTAQGKAKFVKTEKEDKYGRWNDNYAVRDGFFVIHNGNKHHVYKLVEDKAKKDYLSKGNSLSNSFENDDMI